MKITSIKENKDFLNCYRKGKFLAFPNYVVYFIPNRGKGRRLGITTGKKSGNSVERSRNRRIIRVIWYENYKLFPQNCDVVFVAKKGLAEKNALELSRGFQKKAATFLKR